MVQMALQRSTFFFRSHREMLPWYQVLAEERDQRLRALGPPEDNMHSAPSSHTGGSQPSIAPVSEDLTLLASKGTGHTCRQLIHINQSKVIK